MLALKKSILRKTALLPLLVLLIFLWGSPLAYGIDYIPLTPLPGDAKGEKIVVTDYIPRVFGLAIALAGALAVVMIIVGGIQYLSTDAVSGKSEGKERIQNALWGLLLAIGAYVILFTINPGALSFNLDTIQSQKPPDVTAPTTTPPKVIGPPVRDGAGALWDLDPAIHAEDQRIRSTLANVHISINNPNCQKIGDTGCTSLFGLTSTALSQLIFLSNACNSTPQCSITVTGGTEFWLHGNKSTLVSGARTNHKPGGGAVDLSKNNSALNRIITSQPSVSSSGCAPGTAYRINGFVFVDENIPGNPPHWHICY